MVASTDRAPGSSPAARGKIGFVGATLLTLAAVGCSAGGRPIAGDDAAAAFGAISVAEARPIAVAGEPIVLFLNPIPGPDPAGRVIPAELDDGTRLRGEVHRLYIGDPIGPPNWLGHARRWAAGVVRAEQSETRSERSRFRHSIDVAIVEPIPAAGGAVLRIAGATVPLDRRGAPDPDSAARLAAGTPTPLGVDSPGAIVGLFAALQPGLEDPSIRWRGLLLADRLERAGLSSIAERIRATRPTGVAVAAVARSIEVRWRLALGRLERIDAGLAADLLARLTLIVTTPDGVAIPAWTPPRADTGLDIMLEDLLNSSLSDTDAAARVRAWLAEGAEFLAWVIDDAGLSAPGAGVVLTRAGIVDFSGRGGIAQATLDGAGAPGPRLSVAPYSPAIVAASAPIEPGAASITVEHLGSSVVLSAAGRALDAGPPGFRVGPALEPWSLETWRAGSPVVAGGDRATLALLRRRVGGAWEIYIECRTPPEPPPGDRVRLWLGPTGRPFAALVADARGFIFDELMEQPEVSAPRTPIVISRRGDRWSCVIDLPERAIEPPGVVRIALERLDDAGDRRTWPRPMMPGQIEPGRALVSLTRWLGFDPARE